MEHVHGNDFYEDDEPIEQVVAAYERGPHGFTAPSLPGGAVFVTPAQTFAQTVAPRDTPITLNQPQLLTV